MYLQLAEDNYLSKKGKAKQAVAKVLLAPGRALLNLMLDNNIDGLATKFSKMNWSALSSDWAKVGGDSNLLAKNINKGKNKKPKKIGFLNKFKKGGALAECNYMEQNGNIYLSEVTSEQKAGIISAATAAGTAVGTVVPGAGNVVGAAAGASLGSLIVAVLPMFKKAAEDPSGEDPNIAPGDTPNIPESGNPQAAPDAKETTASKLPSWALPVGIGAALLVGGYFLIKK